MWAPLQRPITAETHKGITYRDQELVQVCVWEGERERAREGGWKRACAGEFREISEKRADGCYLHAEKINLTPGYVCSLELQEHSH